MKSIIPATASSCASVPIRYLTGTDYGRFFGKIDKNKFQEKLPPNDMTKISFQLSKYLYVFFLNI